MNRRMCTIREGSVHIRDIYIDEGKIYESFYNPSQKMNRDISLLVYKIYSKHIRHDNTDGLNYMDGFSGTGIRSMRVRREIDSRYIRHIYACDLSSDSIYMMRMNMKMNGIEDINIIHDDINIHMMNNRYKYDIIDVDPYGSSHKYIDNIIYNMKPNSLICSTYTDLKVLEGPDYKRLYSLYNSSRSIYNTSREEYTIRMLYGSIYRTSMKHKKGILPILSIHRKFYIRLFYMLIDMNDSDMNNICDVYRCIECMNEYRYRYIYNGKRCVLDMNNCISSNPCVNKYHIDRNIWTGDINNRPFIKMMIDDTGEGSDMRGILDTIHDEVDGTVYNMTHMYSSMRCTAMSRRLT